MSKIEFLSPEGFRLDGRRSGEIRNFRCRIGGLSSTANGSAMVEMGCTKVVSYVFGPTESNRHPSHPEKAEVHCDFSFAAFSGAVRKGRRWADKASVAKGLTMRQIFQSVILLEKHPKSHIHIYICVLENDGGVISAAINATTLALMDACIPLKDFLASCSVGLLGHADPFVDLSHVEAVTAGAELTLAIHSRTEEITCLNLSSKIPLNQFDKMETVATSACQEIATLMKNAVVERFSTLLLKT